jgi:hypothetical protein
MKLTTGKELKTIKETELLEEYKNACLRDYFTHDDSDKKALIKYAKDRYKWDDIHRECRQHLLDKGILPPTRKNTLTDQVQE